MRDELSKYRQPIMGIAILLVMISHLFFLGIWGELYSIPLQRVRQLCASGVDIFLILSAFGLYYSCRKNSNVLAFYKKRYLRLLPAPFIVFFVAYGSILARFFSEGMPFYDLMSWFFHYLKGYLYGLWFLYLLLFLYTIFPIVFSYLNDATTRGELKNRALLLFMSTIIIPFLLIICAQDNGITDMYGTVMLSLYRVPIFFVGLYIVYEFGIIRYIYKSHALFIISTILSYLSPPELQYIFFAFMALSALKYFVVICEKCKAFNIVFSFIGNFTLELYVVHMFIFTNISQYIQPNTFQILAVAFLSSFVFAVILQYLIKGITQLYCKMTEFVTPRLNNSSNI